MTPCMSCPYLLFINTDVQISAANSVGTYAAQQFLQEHEHEVVGSKSNMQLVTLQRRSQAFVHRPNQFETSRALSLNTTRPGRSRASYASRSSDVNSSSRTNSTAMSACDVGARF